jgi:16S rRNA G966 N2-methylase RsmD
MTDLATNVLYYGDNFDILRRYLPDAAVDLVYLDPPFNSNGPPTSSSRRANGWPLCRSPIELTHETWTSPQRGRRRS